MSAVHPILAITLGDAGGIGPEVSVKAAVCTPWPRSLRLVLVGHASVVVRECRRLGSPVPPVWDGNGRPPAPVTILDPVGLNPGPVVGRCTARAATVALAWIEAAVAAWGRGVIGGLVTAPVNKEGLARAGASEPGHTELLARLTGTRRFAMMLIGGPLRVVLVTRHLPLRAVAGALTAPAIRMAAELAVEGVRWLEGGAKPVAVCGLNPHAGDGGLLGREERTLIAPVIRRLQRRGLPVLGPVPADVVFHQAAKGRYAAVVAMYHDQGLAPLKLVGFETGVNLTLGLPLVRTSPDHGTAYDIAGRGKADARSMVEAIRLAVRLASRPNPWGGARGRRS